MGMGGEIEKSPEWGEASPEIIGEAVLAVLEMGDAVMFSTTSDGGACRLTIFEADGKHHRYVKDGAELEEVCRGISQSIERV